MVEVAAHLDGLDFTNVSKPQYKQRDDLSPVNAAHATQM